jgi:hypothetical protein
VIGVAAALLGLMAVVGGAQLAKAAARLGHACCERAPEAVDEMPCHGFLPLSCCNAAALPSIDREPTPPAAVLALAPSVSPVLREARRAPAAATQAPRPPPTQRSVVLQI